jgi:hypothetical protein
VSTNIQRIRQFTGRDLQLKLKLLFDKFVENAIASNPELDPADLRSLGKMSRHIVKVDSDRLAFATTIPKTRQYYYPLEGPGYDHCKLWFLMDHLGTTIRDISGHGHNGILLGHPTMHRAPINMGYLQTSASFGFPAVAFNVGGDSINATEGEAVRVPDHEDIRINNKTDGFSITFNFNSLDASQHVGPGFNFNRRFWAKTDDATHNATLAFGAGQNDLEFHVVDDGVLYRRELSSLNLDFWYQIAVTYDPNAGSSEVDRIKMYRTGTELAASTVTSLLPATVPNTDLYIGSRDQGLAWFRGYIQDIRMYDFVLSPDQVNNLQVNRVTILPIPISQVATVNGYVLQ